MRINNRHSPFLAAIVAGTLFLSSCDEDPPSKKATGAVTSNQIAIIGNALNLAPANTMDRIKDILEKQLGYTTSRKDDMDAAWLNAERDFASVLVFYAHGNSPTGRAADFNGMAIPAGTLFRPTSMLPPVAGATNYKLVFFSGCASAANETTARAFMARFNATYYVGWLDIVKGGQMQYGEDFLKALDGRHSTRFAVDDANNKIGIANGRPFAGTSPIPELKVYTLLGAPPVTIDLTP